MEYPLIVYNSYKPDNTELIIANMAQREKTLLALDLNKCHFLAFVVTNASAETEKEGETEKKGSGNSAPITWDGYT